MDLSFDPSDCDLGVRIHEVISTTYLLSSFQGSSMNIGLHPSVSGLLSGMGSTLESSFFYRSIDPLKRVIVFSFQSVPK